MAHNETSRPAQEVYRFDRFVLNAAQRTLTADGARLDLGARAFDLLQTFVARPGSVLSKAELLALAWPGVTVDENNLHVQISALRKTLGGGLIATIAGRGYQFTASVTGEAAHAVNVSIPEKSIAVLAFTDMSETKDQQYLGDGVAEEITNALSKVAGLLVAGRTSAFSFRARALDLREVARALNVAHIVEGSVRRQRDRVRITAQLIRASDGFHLWSNSYDGDSRDIFDLQDSIARAIVGEVDPVLQLDHDQRLVSRSTRNREAHDLLLQARAIYRSAPTAHSFAVAEDMLQRAVELDPHFALAWIEIATLNNFASALLENRSLKAAYQASREAVSRAVALDPHAPRVKIWSANVRHFDGDLVGAYRFAQEALAQAPNDPGILFSLAHLKAMYGYSHEALPLLERANRIDPFDGFAWTMRAIVCQNIYDYEAADRFASKAAELGDLIALDVLAWNAFQRGDADLAEERLGRLCDFAAMVWPTSPLSAHWRSFGPAFYRNDQARIQDIRTHLRARFDAPGFEPNGYDIVDAGHFGLFDDVYAQWRHVFAGKSTMAVQIWGEQPWARAFRNHEGFPAFLQREGFVDLWNAHGWPDLARQTLNAHQGASALVAAN